MRRWLAALASFLVLLSMVAPASVVHAESPGGESPSGSVLDRIDTTRNSPARTGPPPPSAPSPDGYGWVLLKMVLVLGAVCVIAYLALRFGLKRFVTPDVGGPQMEVVARLPVEPRRSVLLIRIGPRHLIVGSSENGMERLGELSDEEASVFGADDEPTPRRSFAEIFRLHTSSDAPAELEPVDLNAREDKDGPDPDDLAIREAEA